MSSLNWVAHNVNKICHTIGLNLTIPNPSQAKGKFIILVKHTLSTPNWLLIIFSTAAKIENDRTQQSGVNDIIVGAKQQG